MTARSATGRGFRGRTSPARRWSPRSPCLSAHDWAERSASRSIFDEVVGRLEALRLPETESDPRGMAGNAAQLRPGTGGARRVRPTVRRAGGPGRRAGDGRGASAVPDAAARAVQRGHHGRVHLRRVADGREDPDLRLPPGEGEGGHPGAGRSAAAAGTCGGSSAGGWISGSTPTRRGRRPSWSSASSPCGGIAPTALEQPVPHAEVDVLAELRGRDWESR